MATSPESNSAASPALILQLLDALDVLFGLHPGFRPAHAKGATCSGTFTPSAEAVNLTRAPHVARPSTPIVVRFSDSSGLPSVADNDPELASPRGFAVRFYLADHVHTDIIAHSYDGFPVRTGAEFLEFLHAAAAFGKGQPEALGAFLASHPRAKQFVEAPKPIPSSFARESFFAVTAFQHRRDFLTQTAAIAAATTAALVGTRQVTAGDPSFMNNVPDPLLAGKELPTFKFALEKSSAKVLRIWESPRAATVKCLA